MLAAASYGASNGFGAVGEDRLEHTQLSRRIRVGSVDIQVSSVVPRCDIAFHSGVWSSCHGGRSVLEDRAAFCDSCQPVTLTAVQVGTLASR